MLRLLAGEPNVLLLDEPTNDLDTDTLASLEDLLDSWPGTMIVASHDRYLVERVTERRVRACSATGGWPTCPAASTSTWPARRHRRGGRRRAAGRRGAGQGQPAARAVGAGRRRGAAKKELTGWSGWSPGSTTRSASCTQQLADHATDYEKVAELDAQLRAAGAERPRRGGLAGPGRAGRRGLTGAGTAAGGGGPLRRGGRLRRDRRESAANPARLHERGTPPCLTSRSTTRCGRCTAALAALTGLFVLVFGIVGIRRDQGRRRSSPRTTWSGCSGCGPTWPSRCCRSSPGVVVLVAALIGRNVDQSSTCSARRVHGASAWRCSGCSATDANFLAFSMVNVVVSFIIGMVLFAAAPVRQDRLGGRGRRPRRRHRHVARAVSTAHVPAGWSWTIGSMAHIPVNHPSAAGVPRPWPS